MRFTAWPRDGGFPTHGHHLESKGLEQLWEVPKHSAPVRHRVWPLVKTMVHPPQLSGLPVLMGFISWFHVNYVQAFHGILT